MISYKDMMFCNQKSCANFNKCSRALTDRVIEEAKMWWCSDNPPIQIYHGQPVCYRPGESDETRREDESEQSVD